VRDRAGAADSAEELRLGERLGALAARLVAVPSPTGAERELADLVEAELRACAGLEVLRVGDTVVARTAFGHGGHGDRLLLAGHLDTVPPPPSTPPVAESDTRVIRGLGAVDMKGGLAVMLELARHAARASVELTFVCYAGEEGDASGNELRRLVATRPELLRADAAVLLEPTACAVEAGCQGTARVRVELVGREAHTARPWMGDNAVHRLADVIARVRTYEPRHVVLDGCEYVEQLQAVRVEGGRAGNVVPGHAALVVNHRFAPDRSVEEAVEWLQAYLEPALDRSRGDVVTLLDAAPAAPPGLAAPLLRRLVDAAGARVRGKLGWTDVATLAAIGIPAANFGPGDPSLAHGPAEVLAVDELEHAWAVLARVAGIDAVAQVAADRQARR
jgi:succinyl-diaminopimelate desuccinylase